MQLYSGIVELPLNFLLRYKHGRHGHNVRRGLHCPFHWGVPELLPPIALTRHPIILAHPLPYSDPFPPIIVCSLPVVKPIRGSGLMNADHFRRKARHFFTLAQQSSRPVMIARAAAWMERTERIVQQQQPVQPEPEPSRRLVSRS